MRKRDLKYEDKIHLDQDLEFKNVLFSALDYFLTEFKNT